MTPATPYESVATPRSNREASPVGDFEPFENEAELLGEIETDAEESEGEDLFGGDMERYLFLTFLLYQKITILNSKSSAQFS